MLSMSSSHELYKYCSLYVRHDDGILPNNQLPPWPNASFIQLNAYYKFHVIHQTNQDPSSVETIPLNPLNPYTDTFYLSNDSFLTEDGAKGHIYGHIYGRLDQLGVPQEQQQPMADEFSSFVMRMARDPDFANQSPLPIVLDIYINYRRKCYNGIASEIRKRMEILGQERKWAKTSSIQTLERVDTTLVSMEQCAICLEKFPAGRELARLPCSHVYHQDCIVKWLLKSRFCPMCRFCID